MTRMKQFAQPNLPKKAFAVQQGGMQVQVGKLGAVTPPDPGPTPVTVNLTVADIDGVFGFQPDGGGTAGAVSPSTFLDGTFVMLAASPINGDLCVAQFTPGGTKLTDADGDVTTLLWTFPGNSVTLTWDGSAYATSNSGFAAGIAAAVGTTLATALVQTG
jgi:hypothetical protein